MPGSSTDSGSTQHRAEVDGFLEHKRADRMSKHYGIWGKLGWDAWALGADAASVIGMRTASALAGGDLTGREARLMICEKLLAGMEIQSAFMSGALGKDPATAMEEVLRTYSRKVRANKQRLRVAS